MKILNDNSDRTLAAITVAYVMKILNDNSDRTLADITVAHIITFENDFLSVFNDWCNTGCYDLRNQAGLSERWT
jgi:hypothetical protein